MKKKHTNAKSHGPHGPQGSQGPKAQGHLELIETTANSNNNHSDDDNAEFRHFS